MSGEVRSVIVRLSASTSGYIAEMNRAGAATETAMNRASRATTLHGKALGALGAVAKGTGLAVGVGLGLAVKEAADFGAKMALVRTLSHANTRDMQLLAAAAKTVGLNYGYTASQVADGEAEMIKAGIGLKDILGGGLKGTLALAAAGQTDVATATTIAASAMTQFKLKGSAIPHVADLLAAGADKALGSVEDLGYGLEQSGTTAHQMGLSIDQTVGTLAAFAQAGLIGERGGTTFKQMLLQLSSPTTKAQQIMDKLGISLYNANGQIKTMPELAGNLQHSLEHLTPAQRNAALGTIFGSRAIQAANILMADGQQQIAGWIRKVNDQGFAAHQASGKLNSLKGDLQKFRAAADNAFIDLGSGSQSPLRGFVQDATSELEKLTKNGTIKRWGREVGHDLHAIIHDAGPLAHDVGHALQVVGGGIKTVVEEFNKLPPGVQKALITGGVVALGAHKLGVDSLAWKALRGGTRALTGGGGLLGGVVGRGTPVPVFVTNWNGHDVPGNGKDPVGNATKEGGVAAALARVLSGAKMLGAATPEGLTAYGSTLADWLGSRTVQQRSGHALQGLSGQLFPNAPGGQPLAAGKWWDPYATNWGKDDTTYLDKALAHLTASHPDQTLQMLGKAAKDANVPITALIANLPKTARELVRMGRSITHNKSDVDAFTRNLRKYADGLHKLPRQVVSFIESPGLNKSIEGVKVLADLYHLTPKQIITALEASGVVKTIHDIKQAQRVFNLTPAQLTTLIATSGVDLSKAQVKHLQELYHLTPSEVKTILTAVDDASPTVHNLIDVYGGVPRQIRTSIVTSHIDKYIRLGNSVDQNATGRADGGRIPGSSPHPRADNIPIAATAGEHMWSVAEVQGAGGHGRVERLRYLARSGQLRGFADGGPITLRAAPATVSAGYTQTVTTGPGRGHGPMRISGSLTLDQSGRAFIEGIAIDAADDRIRAHHQQPTGRRHHG